MRLSPLRRTGATSLCSAVLLLGAPVLLLGAPALGQTEPADEPAESPPLELRWSSDEPDCGADGVAARAVAMAGQLATRAPVEADAELRRQGNIWTLRLETRSAEQAGTRTLSGASCKEIQDAVSLLLAMILESQAELDPGPAAANEAVPGPVPPPPPGVEPGSEPKAAPTRPAPPAPTPPSPEPATPWNEGLDEPEPTPAAPPTKPRSELGWLLRLHAGASLKLQPGLGLGLGAAAGVRWRAWDVALAGSFWPATHADVPDSAGHVEITRFGAGLRGCFSGWSSAELSLAGCLQPELIWFRFRSVGVGIPAEGVTPFLVSGTAALEARYQLPGRHFSVALSPGVTLEKRQIFQIPLMCRVEPCAPADPVQAYKTLGVGARLEIGVAARF